MSGRPYWFGCLAISLAACGGSGSGSSSNSDATPEPLETPVFFTLSSSEQTVEDGAGLNISLSTDRVTLNFSEAGSNTNPNNSIAFQRSDDGRGVIFWAPNSTDLAGAQLDYTSYGSWASGIGELQIGVATNDAGAFFQGSATPVSAVPTTGTASYSGVATASEIQGGVYVNTLLGTGELEANFQAGLVSGSYDFVNQSEELWGTVNISNLQIEGNTLIDGIASSTNGHSGDAEGQFFGPNAEEIGGRFNVENDGTNSVVIGGFGGSVPTP